MHTTRLLSAAALALGLAAGSAHAEFISGGISFSDGFQSTGTTSSIVSDLGFIDINNIAQAYGCTGAFAPNPCVPADAFSNDFFIRDNAQIVFDWNGYTFTVLDFRSVTRTALECEADLCFDQLTFLATGSVVGNGFEETGIVFNWTSQGSCVEDAAFADRCGSDVTASWSASITATGRAPIDVPEPHGAALLGLGALAMAFVRRRTQRQR